MGQAKIRRRSTRLDGHKLRLCRRLDNLIKSELRALVFKHHEGAGEHISVRLADDNMASRTVLRMYRMGNAKASQQQYKAPKPPCRVGLHCVLPPGSHNTNSTQESGEGGHMAVFMGPRAL
ncbi:MAG: hypothetical protein V4542_05800 [Pseudomonadota bacterium]